MYGLLNDVEPVRLEPGAPPTLIMAARHDFHLKSLREDPKREIVEWALEQALGAPLRARFIAAGEAQPGMAAVPARRAAAPSRTVDPAPSAPVREDSGAYRAAPPSSSRPSTNGHAPRPATRPARPLPHGPALRQRQRLLSATAARQPTSIRRPGKTQSYWSLCATG